MIAPRPFPTDPVATRPCCSTRSTHQQDLGGEHRGIRAYRRARARRRGTPDAAGLFRLQLPAVLGGAEADPVVQMEVLEALTAIDAASGWCTMIGATGFALLGAYLADSGTARVFAEGHGATRSQFVLPLRGRNRGRGRLPRERTLALLQRRAPLGLDLGRGRDPAKRCIKGDSAPADPAGDILCRCACLPGNHSRQLGRGRICGARAAAISPSRIASSRTT